MQLSDWEKYFTERELKEIEFNVLYSLSFKHGTNGHNERMIIAKMAVLLDGGQLPAIEKKGQPDGQ